MVTDWLNFSHRFMTNCVLNDISVVIVVLKLTFQVPFVQNSNHIHTLKLRN